MRKWEPTFTSTFNYDFSRVCNRSGVVGAVEFARWKGWGKPESWSGAIVGPGIKHVAPEEMEKLIVAYFEQAKSEGKGDPENWMWRYRELSHIARDNRWQPESDEKFPESLRDVYTRVEWAVPYYKRAGELFTILVPELLHAKRKFQIEDSANVRVVFGFDS